MAELPSIYLTRSDLDRLTDLLEAYAAGSGGRRFDKLEDELVRAIVVPRDKIPRDLVTMNSRVVFEDETTGERREVTLVYPRDADISVGKISILVPVGTALLGLRVGQSIDWELPSGQRRRYRVIDVPYQPEAAGGRISCRSNQLKRKRFICQRRREEVKATSRSSEGFGFACSKSQNPNKHAAENNRSRWPANGRR